MSNLVCGLTARRPIQKIKIIGQLGTGPGSRDLLLNFGSPLYLMNGEDTNFEFGTWIDDEEAYPQSCKSRSTEYRTRVTWPTF